MKNKTVYLTAVQSPIAPAPGFAKKHLADYHLELGALCVFGCSYCSSNTGNYLRINRAKFAAETERQLGERLAPVTTKVEGRDFAADPTLTFAWPDVLDKLDAQLRARRRPGFGRGKTLVFSMLTDSFAPTVVASGMTHAVLETLLKETEFRIRVLTKSAIVGTRPWIDFFLAHPGRFVVGLSTGTLDDAWARKVELGTSSPTARIKALHRLQDAGVPTFGMLCPIFPDALEGGGVMRLVRAIRPHLCEHVWAEPYNDRANWRSVRAGFHPSSAPASLLAMMFGPGSLRAAWSDYAVELYAQLRRAADAGLWLEKLKFLLYEGNVINAHVHRLVIRFGSLRGMLLQGPTLDDGSSKHPLFAQAQAAGYAAKSREVAHA